MEQGINSILKKAKTVSKNGLKGIKAINQGIKNYKNPKKEVEILAQKRAEICVNCVFFKDEPNKLLSIDDELIIELDGKMCSDCGCSLPYKTRQSIIKCNKWID